MLVLLRECLRPRLTAQLLVILLYASDLFGRLARKGGHKSNPAPVMQYGADSVLFSDLATGVVVERLLACCWSRTR